jgi:LPXTG-site transpeptidase (sortase) family protein
MLDRRFSYISKLLLLVVVLILLLQFPGNVRAAGEITVRPLTWNVIGLDSNKPVISGPEYFPIGARVCNESGGVLTGVEAEFVLDDPYNGTTTFIQARPGTATTISVGDLAIGACEDVYFEAKVDRDTNAYDTSQEYHIEVTSTETGVTVYSTPTPRKLFVEHLVSQNRNAVNAVSFKDSSISTCDVSTDYVSVAPGGSMALNVGDTYCILVEGTTATNGYEQIESFITLPNTIFQILGVKTTYVADTSANIPDPDTAPDHEMLYGDACTWENDPGSENYMACNGVGKAGGDVSITYTVKIISAPSAPLVNPEPLTTLLYDFSGSSFHYNSDFEASTRYMYIVDPSQVTIEKQFVPDTVTPGGTSTLQFVINNPMPVEVSGVNFVDNFPKTTDVPPAPGNMVVAGTPSVSYVGCGSGAFSPALSGGENTVSFSNGTIGPNSSCVIKVDVTVPNAGDYDNTTENLFIGATDTGNNASDTLTAAAVASCVPNQTLATWTFPSGSDANSPAPTTQAGSVASAATSTTLTLPNIDTGQGNPAPAWAGSGFLKNQTITGDSIPYYQFAIDTSKYSDVKISFDYRIDTNWGSGGAGTPTIYAWSSTTGGVGSYSQIFTTTPVVTFSSSGDLSAAATGTGLTYFRINAQNATNENSQMQIDNVVITGCLESDPPPTISKLFSPNPIAVDSVSKLTFTINNTEVGAVDLTNVQFSDILPTGLKIASTPNASTTCTSGNLSAPANDSTISLTSASMTAGSSCAVEVDVTAISAGQFDNISGRISSDQSGENKGTNGFATDTLTAIAPPSIVKSFSPTTILEGNTTTLSFTITNPNQGSGLSGIAFSDELPAGLDVTTASLAQCGGTLDVTDNDPARDTIVLSGGSLLADSSCTFTVTVTGTADGDYTNTTGDVTATGPVALTGNATSANLIVNPITPQISFIKQISSTNAGPWGKFLRIDALPSSVYYRFVIENTGNVNLTSLRITDPDLVPTAPNEVSCTLYGSDDLAFSAPLVPGDYAYCVYGPIAASTGSFTNTATGHGTYNSVEYDSSDKSATYGTSELSLEKTASPNYFTAANDTISYSYLVTNSGDANLLGPVTVSDDKVTVTCPDVDTVGDGDDWLDVGESITCTATGVDAYTVTAGDVTAEYVKNTATASAGGINSNTVTKRVSLVDSVKSIVTTSENGTSGSNVSIGEIVRYRVVVDLSEGTTDTVQILDNIVSNMSYLNDGTTKVAFISNDGSTCNIASSDTIAFPPASSSSWCQVGDGTTVASITPSYVLPSSAITNNDLGATTSPFPEGDDPLFSLGNLTNNDNDDNEEYIVIEFNSLVRNYAANQRTNTRGNSFSVNMEGSLVDTSNTVTVTIVEPIISSITKSVTTTPTDAGDQIIYELQFTNTGDAPAYDISVSDTLNSVLTGGTVTVAGSTTGGACGTTASTVSGSFSSPTASATVSCLNPSATATITITANVSDTAEAGYSFTNAANLTYTSLPGTGTAGGSNPTGSSTPGGSGDSDGERNGSDGASGTDDYVASSNTVTTTLATPSLAKTINPAGTQYAIGATIPYQVVITMPEGTIENAVITDTIPTNLTYVSNSLSVTFGTDVSSNTTGGFIDSNTTNFFSLSGQLMTLDFNTLTSTASTSANNRTVTIAFDVTVDNVVANQSGTSFTNSATLTYDNPNAVGSLTITDAAPAVSIIEPVLTVSKSPSTITPLYNSTFTYTLTVSHTAASNASAYDLVVTDTLPAGLTGLTNIIVTSTDGAGSCATGVDSSSSTSTKMDVRATSLPDGCVMTIKYDVKATGTPTSTQANDVDVAWTSLSGSVSGERDGTDGPGGALDDYAATDTVDVTISGTPNYTITKTTTAVDTAGNGAIDNAGEIIAYQVVIENTGTLDITSVNVIDTLISLTRQSDNPGNDDNVLDTGEKWYFTRSYTVPQAVMDSNGGGDGDIDNTASVTSAEITTPRTSSVEVPLTQSPELTLTKTGTLNDDDGTTGVSAGDTIDYSFNVENTGNVTITNITLSDTLLTGLTCNSIGSLAPGANADFTCTAGASYTVMQSDINTGSRDNTATATGKDPGNTDVSDDDTESKTLAQNPLIGLAKRLVSVTRVGSGIFDVTFELNVENYGNVTLSNVQVTDSLTTAFPAPTTFAVQSISSSDLAVNNNYDGVDTGDTNLLAGTDTLAIGASGQITFVVRVIPSVSGPFDNTAEASGRAPDNTTVTDDSVDGVDPDNGNETACPTCDDDDDPTNNTEDTPVDFPSNIFDPPFGVKTFDDNGLPILEWTMVWINDNNFPSDAAVSDPIPVGTTFVDNAIPSGYPLPGTTPAGSTTNGVSCTTDSTVEAIPDAETTTTYCYYEGPTVTYPRGRIVWEGELGPDLGATNQATANDELYITFSVRVADGVGSVANTATIDADLNNDNDTDDPGEQIVATAQETWSTNNPQSLPSTGFAPGRVTFVEPKAPPSHNPAATLELEIPALDIRIPIVGVPDNGQGWDVDWLWEQAGWLEGTAFPTWTGNSVLTSHVYLPNGLPGPFVDLKTLRWGNELIVHAYGEEYVYKVQSVRYAMPDNISSLGHEDEAVLTLITCAGYDEAQDAYKYRVVTKAVLEEVR